MKPQPEGYSRDRAEARLAAKLAGCTKYPDAAKVTIPLGDLRKFAEILLSPPADTGR